MATDAARIRSRDRFQVLSLEGGGICGVFSAAMVTGLEKDLGRSVLDHFDLVVGTSTGRVIAAALGAGMCPADVVDVYVSEMRTIFPGPRRLRSVRQLFRPKYRTEGLEALLRRVFGDKTLGESRVPLVIPSFDLGENRIYLFKTPHHERLKRDWRVPLWQAAVATSAAPTFFPAFSLPEDHVRLVDGGVWANNPAMVGVVEAVSMFGQPLKTIRVLSLGTTADPRTRKRSVDNGGLLQWARSPNVVNVLLTGQSAGAFTQVQHLIGRAYRGGASLYEVLLDVTATMPALIERDNGIYVVSNPVQTKENFADRWSGHPHRAQRFFEWAEQAQADFAGLGSQRGVDTVLEKMAGVFGQRAAQRAEHVAGSSLFETLATGSLPWLRAPVR